MLGRVEQVMVRDEEGDRVEMVHDTVGDPLIEQNKETADPLATFLARPPATIRSDRRENLNVYRT
jgi:hypothetical protein